jgi:hypothetical protein
VLAALVLVACGGGDEDSGDAGSSAAEQPVAEETTTGPRREAGGEAGANAETEDDATELRPLPSDYARRVIDPALLKLYIRTGQDLNLEWWVIAAVDQIDLNAGNPNIPPRERIPGIGYSLAAAGAPHDNHVALAARAGGAYADRALRLAGRLVDTVAEQRAADERDADDADERGADDAGDAAEDAGGPAADAG